MNLSALPFPPREFADRGTKWLLAHPAHLRHLLRILLLLFLWHYRAPEEYAALEQLLEAHQQDRTRREEVETMGKTIVQHFIEEGEVRGRAEGRAEGRQQVLLNLLRAKFGELSPAIEDRLRTRSVEELDALALRLLHAQSLEELGL